MAVLGRAELAAWQHRLTYRDAAAAAEVAARLPRLLAPTALFELTYARGDVLSYAARLSALVLDVVAVLGAVNRRFIPVDEPKWLPWHLAQLTLVPAELDDRIRAALTAPSPDTIGDLDAAVDETLDLVDRHVPGADTRAARYAIDAAAAPRTVTPTGRLSSVGSTRESLIEGGAAWTCSLARGSSTSAGTSPARTAARCSVISAPRSSASSGSRAARTAGSPRSPPTASARCTCRSTGASAG